MKDHIIVENEFRNANEIKIAKKALSDLTGCPEILIKTYVQGKFKILGRGMWTNELDLDYDWYEVTNIGNKHFSVHVPSEKKTFRVKVNQNYIVDFNRKPGFKLVADVYNNFSFRR